MRKIYFIILIIFVCLLSSCEIKIKPNEDELAARLEVKRYDRLESRYLTTGDFSALQQMNIDYPMETRTLIEDVLQIGEVNDPQINSKFLKFFQDTVLQSIISDVELQYANMGDINSQLYNAFSKLNKLLPEIPTPSVYSQIGALDQSIIIGDNSIGISLDKYLGSEYPLYKKYYNLQQREVMTREYIVPDCLSFYLLSVYPLKNRDKKNQFDRDLHMGKVMWVVNKSLGNKFFRTKYTEIVDRYMKRNPKMPLSELFYADIS